MTEAEQVVWYLRKCLYCKRDFRTQRKDKYYCNSGHCRVKDVIGKTITIDERPK